MKDKSEKASLAKVLEAIAANEKHRIADTAKLDTKVEDNVLLAMSIQSLHAKTARKVEKISNLLGGGASIQSIRTSPLGKFFSEEIKRNLATLNARGRGASASPSAGGTGIGGRPLLRTAGGVPGAGAPQIGGFTSNMKSLMKMMLPSALGGAAGGIVGGAIGASSGSGSGGGSGGGLGYTPGEGQKYEDLSAYNDRGSRNTNPGNVKGVGYLGQVGQDEKGHAKFATKEAGVAGVVDRLYRYNQEAKPGDGLSGKQTIRQIMQTYAPASDGNDTEGYIARISKQLGIHPDQKIDFKQNPELLKPFVQTIMKNESGGYKAYSEAELNKGIEIGSDKALLGKDAAYEKHAAYLQPKNTPGRRAAETLVAGNSGDLNKDLFDTTKNAQGTRYGYGSKNSASGAIDCSGWVDEAMRKAGAPPEVIAQLANRDAANQVVNTGRNNNTLQATNNVDSGGMKEGQLIGVRNNGSRLGGVGHVGIVVRNPETGELGVSHSSSSKGVTWQPMAEFQRNFGKNGFLTSDPLAASRQIKKDEQEKADDEKQTNDLAANTKQVPTEVAAALTGQEATAQAPSEAPGTPVAAIVPKDAGSQDAKAQNAPAADAAKNGPSFQEYLKDVAGVRLTREADYGLGDSAADHQKGYRDYLASRGLKDPDPDSTDNPFFAEAKEPEPALQENLDASGNKVAEDSTPPLQETNAPKQASLTPSVTPVVRKASARQPLSEKTQAQAAPAPIIIQQAPQQKERQESSSGAGGSLPMKVDSVAVQAFQLDPLTPIHS